ncbi:MAG: hypothetical protein ABSH22_15965 [Tepidisphaeraceae bacterium]|jgi:tetratricopeptide (TPR) repeat protein
MLRRFVISAFLLCLAQTAFGQNNPNFAQYWLARAMIDAQGLSDPAEKAGVETTIAEQYASIPEPRLVATALDAATVDAQKIPDPVARFRAMMNLATAHDQADDQNATKALILAETAAAQLPPGPARDAAPGQLSNAMAVFTGFDAAAPTISAISDPQRRALQFADLATTYADGSQRHQTQDYPLAIAAADAAAQEVSDPGAKHMLLAKLVQTRVAVGDLPGAEEAAKTVSDPTAQGLAYAALASAYIGSGKTAEAATAVMQMVTAAGGAPDDRRVAIWLDIAHAHQVMGEIADARSAIDNALRYAQHLQPADEADAYSEAAQLYVDLQDPPAAASAIGRAMETARGVVDQGDLCEVMMTLAAAQARCSMGNAARSSVAQAQAAGAQVPADKRNAEGEPPPESYLTVIQAAVSVGDYATAQAIADSARDRHVTHDAALAIAQAQIGAGQYQAAEDTATREGSLDTEAAVCGMIAASLAKTRSPAIAETWVVRLTTASDKVAARLAIAQVEPAATPTTLPTATTKPAAAPNTAGTPKPAGTR